MTDNDNDRLKKIAAPVAFGAILAGIAMGSFSQQGGTSPAPTPTPTPTPIPTPGPILVTVAAIPTSNPVGVSISLSAGVTGGVAPFTFAWGFGDGMTASGPNVNHAYAAVGTYNPTCKVTDSTGHQASGSRTVTITAPSTQTATITWKVGLSNPTFIPIANAHISIGAGPGLYDGFTDSTGTLVMHGVIFGVYNVVLISAAGMNTLTGTLNVAGNQTVPVAMTPTGAGP